MLHKEDFAVMKALHQRGVYQTDIAAELGVHPKTVSRSLKRGGAPSGQRAARGSLLDAYKQRVDQLLVHFSDDPGPLDVLSPMEILGRKQPSELGMLDPNRHQQQHELAHACERVHLTPQELALPFADRLVSGLQSRCE